MEAATVEVEALRSIFGDELIVEELHGNRKGSIALEMKVRPVELGEHSPASLRVRIELGSEYPSQSPLTYLLQPRGVDERNLRELKEKISQHLVENLEMPVLYDVFQLVLDFLEKVQACPSAACPICLVDFSDDGASLCTECEHFVHRDCFSAYIAHSKERIARELADWPPDMHHKVDQALRCPMCRLELSEKDSGLADANASALEWGASGGTVEWDCGLWRQKQRELSVILDRQRRCGGLIDPEEERLRSLVTETTSIPRSSAVVETREVVVEPPNVVAAAQEPRATTNSGRQSGNTDGRRGWRRNPGAYNDREGRRYGGSESWRREHGGTTGGGYGSATASRSSYRYSSKAPMYVPAGAFVSASDAPSFTFRRTSAYRNVQRAVDPSPNA